MAPKRPRRILIWLPADASESILTLAEEIKNSLSPPYNIRIYQDGSAANDDNTPVENQKDLEPILIRIGF